MEEDHLDGSMVRSPHFDYTLRNNESEDDSDSDVLRDDGGANPFTSILTPRHQPPPLTFRPLVNYSPNTSTDQSPEGRARKASQADLGIAAQGLADSLQPPEQVARKKLSTIAEASDESLSGASKY